MNDEQPPLPPPPAAFAGPVTLTERTTVPFFGRRLVISLLVHLVLLALAVKIVVSVMEPKKKEDVVVFSPVGSGGGSSGPKQASLPQQKRWQNMASLPRLAAKTSTSTFQLPEIQRFSDPLADVALLPGSMSAAGGGGFGGGFGSGTGPGSGPGMGMRGGRGFVASFFGRTGDSEAGLLGQFYDLKQDRDGNPTPFENNEAAYAAAINDAAARRFNYTSLRKYYQARQQMTFTYLAVPRLAAEEGPKAFAVEKEVQPTAWFVHYSGRVTAPSVGPWRFVGLFDDALVVYVNGKPVLDGSWYPLVDYGGEPDPEIRQLLPGGPPLTEGPRRPYAGKWVKLDKDVRLDIIIGERPGGLVGGVLCIEKQGEKYDTHEDGAPILPLFTTKVLDREDKERIKQFEESRFPYPVAKKTPVFLFKSL